MEEQLYRENVKIVYRFCLSLCHDESTAQDLTQETFLRTYRSCDFPECDAEKAGDYSGGSAGYCRIGIGNGQINLCRTYEKAINGIDINVS